MRIIFLIALVIGVVMFYLFMLQPRKVITNPVNPSLASVCTESTQKIDALGNIYTCIGETWVYTGNTNDIKG